ncbi:MAG: pyridoxal-dependent decarboxylase [Gammaproteobacteria bacterium]|nr:pyridoxal-dependent decarboxylase [Gammaproteobacteria bacterium]
MNEARRGLLLDAASRAADYLDGLEGRDAAPDKAALEGLEALGGPLPETGTAPDAVLEELDRVASPATMASAGGRYFGFVIGGSLPAALAANMLASAWDQNAGLNITSPAAAKLEDVAEAWLKELLQLPGSTAVGFVSGATTANLCALLAARHSLLAREGWDVARQGLYGAPPINVIVGDEVHVSIQKALSVLGLGRDRVTRVPTDSRGRMRADLIPQVSGPTLVCLQAGNVNTGDFDPVGDICNHLDGSGAWVHVDAAFGLWARTCPETAALAAGLEKADSWSTDAHKWLNVPYDSGLVMVKQGSLLREALAGEAAYLVQAEAREPWQYTPELSRRARGADVWAALRSLGSEGIAELVARNCRQARRFAEGLRNEGFEILNEVVLNQVLVSFGEPEITREVIARIQRDGTCWVAGTEWQGRTALRISVSSWATTDEDVEKSLAAMIRCARQ